MQNGAYPARENVWAVNKRYIKEQGALFAKNLAMLSGAVSCTEEENDYEYKHNIIYEDTQPSPKGDANESLRGSPPKTDEKEKGGSLIAKLLKGLFAGGISLGALGNLLSAAGIGEKIYKHYMAFPDSTLGFDAWVQKTEKLWAKTCSMASIAEKDLQSGS
jgi:hypothetical protein